jgi:hypothetical protein
MLDHLDRAMTICNEISGNRHSARSYVDALYRASDAIEGQLDRIDAAMADAADCAIDPPAAGLVEELTGLAADARAADIEAQAHLTRASDCAQRIAAGGTDSTSSRPGAVAASTVKKNEDGAGDRPVVQPGRPGEPTGGASRPGAVAASTVSTRDVGESSRTASETSSTNGGSAGGGRDEIELVYVNVDLELAQDDSGIYDALDHPLDTEIIVRVGDGEQQLVGMDAVQLMVREGYLVYRDGVGLIATDKLTRLLGTEEEPRIADASRKTGSEGTDAGTAAAAGAGQAPAGGRPSEPEGAKADSVFGATFDDDLEEYNPNDPNTPEGRKKRLRELNDECTRSKAFGEFWNCIWSCFGDECRDACMATYEKNKPQVCRDADALAAELGVEQ